MEGRYCPVPPRHVRGDRDLSNNTAIFAGTAKAVTLGHIVYFVLPLGVDPQALEHWSSFPSDHAALAFAVSTCLWRASRPLGAACYIWSIFIICLPRIYAGYHYATDIVGGAMVGIFTAFLVARPLQKALMPSALMAEELYPGLFFACFFVVSYEFVT